MRIKLMLMALAVALPAWAQAPEWQDAGGLSYLCGGVGQGSFAAIRAQRDSASVELLLTAGARGMYLADVTVTVTGPTLDGPVVIPREGPLCLLRVPPGRYTVSAEYAGQTLEHRLGVGEGLSAVHLNFKE